MRDACAGIKASLLFKLIAITVFSFLIAACNSYRNSHNIHIVDGLIYKQGESKPFTGRILDTLENKIIEYDVIKGLRNGEFCVSTLDGNFTVHGSLKDNQNVGTWSYFYKGGQLESRGNFNSDLPHGKWQWFHEDGTLKSEGYYINGTEEGVWKTYNNNGTLTTITRFVKGEKMNEVIFAKQKNI
jgi:antitoxin component YwqK of YwqJK toxin-antitoxin module